MALQDLCGHTWSGLRYCHTQNLTAFHCAAFIMVGIHHDDK